MTTKNVTVVQIETIKGTKSDRIVLHYVGNDGSTWKIGALAAKLDSSSRETLKAAKKGDVLSVDLVKEGNYWNLTRASSTTEAASSSNSGSSSVNKVSSSPNKTDVKIQVMNALTNAVASLGAGKTTKEYKDRVIEFFSLGNDVVDLVLSGNLTALTSGAATEVDNNDDVVDEIGF